MDSAIAMTRGKKKTIRVTEWKRKEREEEGPHAQGEAARQMNRGRWPAGLRLNLMCGGASSSPALVKRK